MIIQCKDEKSIKNPKNTQKQSGPTDKIDNHKPLNREPPSDNTPPSDDDDADYFDNLIKNKGPEIDEESLEKYIINNQDELINYLQDYLQNNTDMTNAEKTAFIKTFFNIDKIEDLKDIKASDIKVTAENFKNLDTKQIMSLLSQFHNRSSYETIKETVIPLNKDMIFKLQEKLPSSTDISKLKPLRAEAFDIKNKDHVRILKKMDLSGKFNRHNPPYRQSLIETAENSGIDGSYYICYNEDNKIIGIFSIYSSSASLGDVYSLSMAVDESETGKGYGTSLVLCALIQIASLNNKQLIECRSVHTLVEEQNIGSMKIMEKIIKIANDGKAEPNLFSRYYSRSLNACKFDLSKMYNIILNIVSQTSTK